MRASKGRKHCQDRHPAAMMRSEVMNLAITNFRLDAYATGNASQQRDENKFSGYIK
ncbi:hypothetical protein AB434_1002 [Heyndrickxia coagulans]|nr:hypothetical protein AB434_1002 [Heyndrickxia coagulans]